MIVQVGQRVPSVTIKQATADGGIEVDPAQLFAGKRVVMFSVPGAFTPTCSAKHLPGYLRRYNDLREQGVDLIACLAVNDAWVMQAWANAHEVGDKIAMLADGALLLTRALGLEFEMKHMGLRCRRGVFVLQDGAFESVAVEEPGKFEVSSADACLLQWE